MTRSRFCWVEAKLARRGRGRSHAGKGKELDYRERGALVGKINAG